MLHSSSKTGFIPPLASGEIQIWRIDLNEEPPSETELLGSLSSEEVDRAGKLRQGLVRMQFLAGRSWLRKLLAVEFGLAPNAFRLLAREYGKPEMVPVGGRRVHFNVAHSRSTVLVAASRSGPIGIDIEYLDRNTDILEVARHALTTREINVLLAISDVEERNHTFFRYWTRKEAVVKADGRGLSLPLTSFEVPASLPCHAMPVDIANPEKGIHRRYYVNDLALGPGVACALAVADVPMEHRLHAITFAGASLPK